MKPRKLLLGASLLAGFGNKVLQRELATARTDLANAERRAADAERLAFSDSLTGLANRRAIDVDVVRRTVAGESYALVMIDLDGFKQVNDHHGHAAGDIVLAETARRLTRVVTPGTDLVGRLGGDEFLLLVDCSYGPFSLLVAHDVVRALCEPITIDDGLPVGVTASVGFVQAMPSDDPRAVKRSADLAMYQAKAAGGDIAVEFGPNKGLATVGDERPLLRTRDIHPHRVPAELGVVIAR